MKILLRLHRRPAVQRRVHANAYDASGNLTFSDAPGTANDRFVSYSADGKPWRISMASSTSPTLAFRFFYGPDGQCYKAVHS